MKLAGMADRAQTTIHVRSFKTFLATAATNPVETPDASRAH
jgi:hypothetical protein